VIDLSREIPAKGGTATVQQVGAIGSTNDVPHQSVNQTTFPRPPQIGTSTPSDDVQPVWSPDEAWIYFASNRSNPDGTAAGANYHIWRMSSDGNRVEQVTGTTPDEAGRDQFTPTAAPNGLIAYSERAGANAAANIVVLDIRNPGSRIRTQVTGPGTDPRFALGDCIGPTWSPSSDTVAFAANKSGVYNIYTVNLRLADVRQLTNGTTANNIDCRDPNWSPGGTLIAFDSNAAGVDAKTGLLSGTATTRNVFVSYATGPNTAGPKGANTQPFVQMTNFAGANSIEPAFSPKAGGNSPNDTNSMRLLAFASQRADAKDTGKADTVVATYHLFWIIADDGTDQPGTTNSMPEDPTSNPAEPIFTQDTNPNLPVASRYKSNERHPSFPPFIRSIRIAYASDLAGNNDIWTTPFVDVNAPSLQAVNAGSGEIVRVARVADASPAPNAIGRREFVAGDQVVIMAHAVDLESGIARTTVGGKMVPTIYAQIRDPDSKYEDAAGKEHKTFQHMDFMMQGPAPQNPIAPIAVRESFNIAIPQEVSSQVLDTRDPTGTKYTDPFYPNTKDVTPMPDPMRDPMCPPLTKEFAVLPPTYIPGQSDATAWSGKKFAPRGEWLPLYDDGPVSQGGHEPEGQVAGDGIFSNVWQTPPIPSDYLVDIITYDRAVDPLGRGPGQNWKIWDNVWGFTTQPFIVQNPVLAVMDYPEGQRFLSHSGGGRFTGGGSTPVESYLLDLDTKLMPKTLAPMDIDACPPEMPDSLVSGTYGGKLGPQNTIGTGSFRGDGYDLWRVICRGPVDPSILLSYAPTQVQQVDPTAFDQAPSPNGNYPTVAVPAAEKAVYWASPYSGDLWVGPGTITDASTQALLTDFVQNRSGRLFITGQDIGWALTLNGSLDNAFYRDVLKAKYVSDAGVDENQIKLTGVTDAPVTNDWPNRDIASPLSPLIKEDPSDPYPQSPTSTRAPDTLYIGIHGTDRVRTDGALNQGYPDHILPLTGALPAYAYADGLGDGAIYSIDTKSNGRVVYLSFGLEALLREYDSSNPTIVLNFRSKLLHNALCWATTGQIRGRVVDVQGLGPVSGAVVRAIPDPNNTNGAVTRTAVTDANGNYVIRGLVPQPKYDIIASVPGFTSQHLTSPPVHGVAEAVSLGDLLVSQAAPGSISGTVRSTTGSPVPGAVVAAKLTAAPGYLGQVDFAASTNAQGLYRFGALPVGSYTVTIDPTYLSTSGYNGATPAKQTAGVQAATESSGLNFTLGGGTTVTPGTGGGTVVGGATGGTGLQSFQPGAVYFSVPYDYPNDDAAAVLGLQPSDIAQKLAICFGDPGDRSGFVFYPDPAVRNLKAGNGYYVRLTKPAVITKMGTPLPTNQAFSISLPVGWNLIGDPFNGTVRWSDVKVQVSGQAAPITTTQAAQQGVLPSGLLVPSTTGSVASGSTTLDPWHAYWVRATKTVTLSIPPPSVTATTASVSLPVPRLSGETPPLP
jgi:hypothetical protein